jgi:L-iditol 2-dehydrogenase
VSHLPAAHHSHPRRTMLIEPGRMELRDFDPPHPEAGEVLIEVKCALSCGTDLKTFRRGHPLFAFPMPFGHEFSGVVAETGSGVSTFKTGDGFMAAPTAPCGKCFYCLRRQENLCPDTIGRMVLGAYADYLLIPEHVVALFTPPRWLIHTSTNLF